MCERLAVDGAEVEVVDAAVEAAAALKGLSVPVMFGLGEEGRIELDLDDVALTKLKTFVNFGCFANREGRILS